MRSPKTLDEQNRLDQQEDVVTRLWLEGWTPDAIAADVAISISRTYQILRLARKLLNTGEYDEQLAANAAAGFTNLPVKGQSKAGRPPLAFTELDLAIRAAHAAGKTNVRALAREFNLPRDRVRSILAKRHR